MQHVHDRKGTLRESTNFGPSPIGILLVRYEDQCGTRMPLCTSERGEDARDTSSILGGSPDGAAGYGCDRALPRHLLQETVLVGCNFSKWLYCFPFHDQKATTVAKIVAQYRAFPQTGEQTSSYRSWSRCVACLGSTRRGLPPTTRGLTDLHVWVLPKSGLQRHQEVAGRAGTSHIS